MRLALLLCTMLAVVSFAEWYSRTSRQYEPIAYHFLRHSASSDPTNAVFGDSHVLTAQRIPGYSFFGWAGEQPEEFLALVQYLYADTKPKRIILEADPQWFGEYHAAREKLATADNFINRHIPLVLSSAYYRATLLKNLVAEIRNWSRSLFISRASAAPTARSAQTRWGELFGKPGFNWTWMTLEERALLTEERVLGQNPREGFEASTSARDFEQAIAELVQKGASVCLFRTPVTQTYLDMTQTIANSRYAAHDKYIKAIAERWHLKYVDFHSIPLDFDDTAFLNQDHMTDAGYDRLWPLVDKACF